ncbi:selenium cofactor biosynthesis protein YqeC [Sporomusa acidovorans]|uniref:Selenium-dependent hydroxylase accessory protein YqeC n=1 Tax=Sporomusa acidovorans (strain ATCC 49682 / DSM 3132 / Mol) TaxID=1123286 RepID=A0ABZ3J817_SPOA4|nr:selenium cofactor biosynthesis protein YqeC [Sporomusa acidovorans]OZC21257.1 hypothetical protein SPACI_21090 [Sporomusa acidovorans DSM 3132]SDE66164.1 probable selenium-dependent hydroxylase accessory protein YqeC [Sporomusa acidovorans]
MLKDALGLKQPGVVACVGAGGKTSVVQSLAAELDGAVVVTSTTKMFCRQVDNYALVMLDHCSDGVAEVAKLLLKQPRVAWFAGQVREKIIGLPPEWVDKLAVCVPDAYILVEADGARRCLLKAPSCSEPVIPERTAMTVGVLNIGAMGQMLSPENTHRLELVTAIIQRQPGDRITWQDIARLAVHPQGIFQYARGTKVLLLSGNQGPVARQAVKEIAGYVKAAQVGIERVVAATGYGDAMRASAVFVL